MRLTLTCLALLFAAAIANAEDVYYLLEYNSEAWGYPPMPIRAELDVEGDAFVLGYWSSTWRLRDLLKHAALEVEAGKLFSDPVFTDNSPRLFGAKRGLVVRTSKKTDFTVTFGKTKQTVSADQAATGSAKTKAYRWYILGQYLHNNFEAHDAAGWAIFNERKNHYGKILCGILNNAGYETKAQTEITRWQWSNFNDPFFNLFSGTSAIRNNLDLRAVPRFTGEDARTIDVDSVKGITVAEIDWKSPEYRLNETPKLDPLAYYVPEDQHFVVFPSIHCAKRVLDSVSQFGLAALATPIPTVNETVPTADYMLVEKYLGKLGLSPEVLEKLAASPNIKSVAITGSDPYFAEGTDVAVLLETDDSEKVLELFDENRRGITVSAIDEKTVMITCWLSQMERIHATIESKKSLAALDEFRYFRNRYKVGDADESVFVFLSDATIRRWCSPQWRIGQARRLQAQSRMALLTVERMDDFVIPAKAGIQTEDVSMISLDPRLRGGDEKERNEKNDFADEYIYNVSQDGVRNSIYGTYSFLTPIAELGIDKISQAERNAYERWRDSFERTWRGVFDPIGIRLSLGENMVKTDLTVIPINTRDADFLAKTGADYLLPKSPRYDVPMQLIAAFDKKSQLWSWLFSGEEFSWVGNYVSIYFDEDPFWNELLKYAEEVGGLDTFVILVFLNNSTPAVVLEIASKDKTKHDEFITQTHFPFEFTADLKRLQHGDTTYFSCKGFGDNSRVFYASLEDRLLISLNENTLKRALDRKAEAKTEWLGKSVGMKFDSRAVKVLDKFLQPETDKAVQRGIARNKQLFAWYKERFPKENAVQLHQRLFGERLLLPEEMKQSSPLAGLKSAEFGVTFENGGLRARGEVSW